MPRAPLNITIIEQRLIDKNRTISVLYYGGKAKDKTSLWKCHDCGHEWTATSSDVLNGGCGCPPCGDIRRAEKQRLSLVEINQRLIDDARPITLLSRGENVDDSASKWKCHDCGHVWTATATSILNNGRGCPPCGRTSMSNKLKTSVEEIKQRLITDGHSITLVSYGNNTGDISSTWKCNDCGHEWSTCATNIFSKNSGCPTCATNCPITEEAIKQRLIDDKRTVLLIKYGNALLNNSSKWKCDDCGNEWNASASHILHGSGCPHCADYGFNPGNPAHVYLHAFNGFIKIGITNKLEQRHRKLDNQTVNGVTYTIESSMSWYFEKGSDAAKLESSVLKMFEEHAHTGLMGTEFDGRTELFENAAHQKILDYIAENYDISYA